jgi:hypothetical protein
MIYQKLLMESKPILFADHNSIAFISSNLKDFKRDRKFEFNFLKKWFKANGVLLNFDKTHFVQFTTKNRSN